MQYQILNSYQKISNYFTGKTVVSKELAKRIKEENANRAVYFVSLVASSKNGIPEKTRHVFDVLTEWFEFNQLDSNSSSPIPVDVQYLKRFYEEHRTSNDPKNPNVYYLAEFFLKCNTDSSFIFDEVPILAGDYGIYIYLLNVHKI